MGTRVTQVLTSVTSAIKRLKNGTILLYHILVLALRGIERCEMWLGKKSTYMMFRLLNYYA